MAELFSFALPETFHMWFTIGLIAVAIVAYVVEKIPLELTSIALLAILLVFFQCFPYTNLEGERIIDTQKILMGFANPALITILCLLVLGQAVVQTGALNSVANLILRISRDNIYLSLFITLTTVLCISGILNNTPVVVIFIPIVSSIARSLNTSVSKMLMPLSYAAIMGGRITLIGSSTNLLVSNSLKDMGLEPLGFFDFTLIGFAMAAIGLVYMIFVVPKVLPDRASLAKSIVGDDERQFAAQMEITHGSDLTGAKVDQGHFPGFEDISIRMIQRGEHAYLSPFEENMTLRPGDIIIVTTTRKSLAELLANNPEGLVYSANGGVIGDDDDNIADKPQGASMAEVVIAPGSRMIGQTLAQVGFHHNHNAIVLGIQRQSRVIRARVTEIRLAAGDVLLIMGKRDDILSLQGSTDVLLMEWSTEDISSSKKGVIANTIFFSVVGLAALDLLPIAVGAFTGAFIAIFTGCINLRQAVRALDKKIIFMVSSSLALGTALQATGGASFIADTLISAMEGSSPQMVLSALFLLMIFFTNVLSNNACAVLFTPIAVGTALQLGVNPQVFAIAVIFATSCSFATPMGYQTNLLVMAPGHYKFSDFMRAGIPLALILWIAYSLFAPWFYGF